MRRGIRPKTPKGVLHGNWEYGIHYAYEGRFFFSPPVDGWTFIVSRSLPYALADGTNTIVEGEPTSFEKKYNLYNTLSEDYANDPDYSERQDIDWPDDSMTMEVAGAWSINLQDLEGCNDLAPRLGFLGSRDW
jgi:hypothetical protein